MSNRTPAIQRFALVPSAYQAQIIAAGFAVPIALSRDRSATLGAAEAEEAATRIIESNPACGDNGPGHASFT